MKTDNYLNLCLEQAANSPLRYRHGCIIVRGGKVIGQGFNDHRAGFDGGALKTGRLPIRSLDSVALAELKKKHKLKRNTKNLRDENVTPFTPFEAMGGGKLANTPLSMHSEMMAIHSALSASTTLVSMAVSSQKPYFKLSGGSKRKARLRRDAVKTYVETINKLVFKSGDVKALHLDRSSLNLSLGLMKDHAFQMPTENSIEKHRTKNQKNRHHEKDHHENNGQHKQEHREDAHKLPAQQTVMGPCPSPLCEAPVGSSVSDTIAVDATKYRTDTTPVYTKHSKKQKNYALAAPPPKTNHVLIPKGRTGEKGRSITERKKHPRLHGADLYVARLGWQTSASGGPSLCCNAVDKPNLATTKQATGSLHEELLNPDPIPVSKAKNAPIVPKPEPSVLASRPCYRCIAYMHSVGIKRVFWTTSSGEWECAKVRDLVDALDDLGSGDTVDAHTTLNNVFVTKHEVLMLRRMMGGDF
ncbi:hypothetical protein SLS60_001666 [Paraconiothyrium brasiliense]|uniref:CMP/dCMP-type deaminase domain-containing protein n=1 Tax=Paraconiothyrium brasiliense TaxID=300254 RepID=A0ABR3RZZ9_9PLEO